MNYTSMKQKANSGAHNPFTIGKRFPVELTDGRTVEIAYIGKNEDGKCCMRFMSALAEIPMNEEWTNKDGWGGCEARRVLNSKILELLPADLRAIIAPNNTVYATADGELHTCEDLLWLPSETELCGKDCLSPKQEGEQFLFFRDWRNRLIGDTDNKRSIWQWTRSVCSGSSYGFVCVNSNGGFFIYGNAGTTYGVAPCFII